MDGRLSETWGTQPAGGGGGQGSSGCWEQACGDAGSKPVSGTDGPDQQDTQCTAATVLFLRRPNSGLIKFFLAGGLRWQDCWQPRPTSQLTQFNVPIFLLPPCLRFFLFSLESGSCYSTSCPWTRGSSPALDSAALSLWARRLLFLRFHHRKHLSLFVTCLWNTWQPAGPLMHMGHPHSKWLA